MLAKNVLLPLAGNHYESSVFFVIGTGNKGNELIAVLGSHPCIVQTFFFIILNGVVIVCFVGTISRTNTSSAAAQRINLRRFLLCRLFLAIYLL